MVHKALFSSKSSEWETPPELFHAIDDVFHFDFDVCATHENYKVHPYYTIEDDALSQDWDKRNIWYWMNPPYGDSENPCKKNCKKKRCETRGYHTDVYIPGIGDWVTKAYQEHMQHGVSIVCLIPARTDTQYYHNTLHKAQFTVYLEGRFKFLNPFMEDKYGATFPSMLAIFTEHGLTDRQILRLDELGDIRVPYTEVRRLESMLAA